MREKVEAELLVRQRFCVSVAELARSSGFSDAELTELAELGALAARRDDGRWLFSADCVDLARMAQQLREDFELSLPAVALVLAYRERVRELEQQLHRLTCRLPLAP